MNRVACGGNEEPTAKRGNPKSVCKSSASDGCLRCIGISCTILGRPSCVAIIVEDQHVMTSSTMKYSCCGELRSKSHPPILLQNPTRPDDFQGCQHAFSKSVENEDPHRCVTVDLHLFAYVYLLESKQEHKGHVLELKL